MMQWNDLTKIPHQVSGQTSEQNPGVSVQG